MDGTFVRYIGCAVECMRPCLILIYVAGIEGVGVRSSCMGYHIIVEPTDRVTSLNGELLRHEKGILDLNVMDSAGNNSADNCSDNGGSVEAHVGQEIDEEIDKEIDKG
ncbi:hypothetical protein BGZ79_005719 [Entomortierella chlamydospora]|nr:hypothetical protein BGZ79_005719 [Entomortierella chlamydospora]